MFRKRFPASAEFHRKSSYRGDGTPVIPGLGVQKVPGPWKRYSGVPTVELPPPGPGSMLLEDALQERLSCRHFKDQAVPLGELARLLGAGFGVKESPLSGRLERPLPSGGARYPLELYVLARSIDGLAPGVHHYAPKEHLLEHLRGPLPWESVVNLFLGQSWLKQASAIFVISAVFERTLERYGERGFRFLHFEAGHLAQNLTLLAASRGLATLSLGGFVDAHLAAMLGFDPEIEIPLYGLAVGHPEDGDREFLRSAESLP